MTDTVVVKRQVVDKDHKLSILKDIYVEWGDKGDWDALCELHYKGHSLAAGPRFMRCVYAPPDKDPELIGVLVFGSPLPLNKGRNRVFKHLKPNKDGIDNTYVNKRRMMIMNRTLVWNNRTVLDTMFRSAGIAYRFKNLAYRMYCSRYGKQYVESNSSMGRFNPFSIKAGMRFIRPDPPNAQEVGVEFFKSTFFCHPCDTASMIEELDAMPEGVRKSVEERIRAFYYKNSAMEKSGEKMHLGMSRINELPIDYVLKQSVQIVFGATIYWVWGKNPDTQPLPPRLPLLAFDRQGVLEPLKLTEEEKCNVCST